MLKTYKPILIFSGIILENMYDTIIADEKNINILPD